ncbi:hypothetical protein N8H06_003647, partial [Shigella sonnei]|nr:hypothetical protein [Shigella flexneri]EJV9940323.1 hypothetical protein [Shigella sonnei]HCS1926436.1 hypothetical protein [Shigella boydii]EJQ3009264.1 hypothetical protein [Shigella flexneri]HCS1993773.1 hypothetical protein [Shigella boydii]
AMIYIEQLELIHKSGDVLYPVKITRKSSGKTAFHLVPFGLNKTHDLLEVEDASEAIRLVIDDVIPFAAVHLQQLLRIKRASELSGQVYTVSRVLT